MIGKLNQIKNKKHNAHQLSVKDTADLSEWDKTLRCYLNHHLSLDDQLVPMITKETHTHNVFQL